MPNSNVLQFVQGGKATVIVPALIVRPVDSQAKQPDDEAMSTITREEFDAKLETIEARMDGRVARIEGKIDAFLVRSEGNEKILTMLGEKAAAAAESAAKSADRAGGLKSVLVITSLTTILSVLGIAVAAYFGTQQSSIGIVQSTIAAFESGKAQSVQPLPQAPTPQPAAKK